MRFVLVVAVFATVAKGAFFGDKNPGVTFGTLSVPLTTISTKIRGGVPSLDESETFATLVRPLTPSPRDAYVVAKSIEESTHVDEADPLQTRNANAISKLHDKDAKLKERNAVLPPTIGTKDETKEAKTKSSKAHRTPSVSQRHPNNQKYVHKFYPNLRQEFRQSIFNSSSNNSMGILQGSFTDWYAKFLDMIIHELEELTNRTADPSPRDLERVACINGFNSFFRHITSSWAINMLDSASKLQSGLLQGNLQDMGAFDECINVKAETNASDPHTAEFTGQHCLVSFNFIIPGNQITLNGVSTPLVELFGVDWIPLQLGQCYPSLCRRDDLQDALNAVLSVPDNVLELFGVEYGINVTIAETDCQVKGHGRLDALDWIVFAILLFFVLICAGCTFVDYFFFSKRIPRPANLSGHMVFAFSLYTNGGKLLNTKLPADAMPAINGLKAFSIAWVVLGHSYRFIINQPLVNLLDFPEEIKQWSKMILFSGPLSVDTFFLISGLLNMYGFAIVREKRRYNPLETLITYVHRYLRLTPAYLVMIGISATWLYHSGDGPYWERLVGTVRTECRANYWENLVYLNNYLNPDHYCMMQSWYLSADMQMLWLSPLVVYPLWRWPIFGMIEVTLLTIASILSPLLVSYFYEIRTPIPLTTNKDQASKEMAVLYLPTHTKTVSYVIGIMAGYFLYKLKRGKIKFHPNKITLGFFWLAAAFFMLFAVFGGYSAYQRDDNYSRVYSAFYIGFYRFFWAIGLVWIAIACITGYGGPINTILSWKPLGPLARLSYCIYLTHVAVILRGVASKRTAVYYSDYSQVEQYLGDLAISIGAATVLTLLFEAPMMRIEKLIFEGGLKQRPRRAEMTRETSHTHNA